MNILQLAADYLSSTTGATHSLKNVLYCNREVSRITEWSRRLFNEAKRMGNRNLSKGPSTAVTEK
jgi:hypothetical protein